MVQAELATRTGATARRRREATGAILATAVTGLVLLTGCGVAGNPQPPTLWLPAPVKDLSATRVANSVHLHWTMPKNTTDKVALKGDQRGHFCWEPVGGVAGKFDAKSCQAAGDEMFIPGKPADCTVPLPTELTSGTARAAAFYLELQNHAGKTAGPSNAAWVPSGVAPPDATGLQLEASAAGVVLHWQPAAVQAGMVLRIHRELVGAQNAAKPDQTQGLPPPQQQTLEVDLAKTDPGGAVDSDALLDHSWKYKVERVLKIQADGHALEIVGRPSDTVTIDAKDVFPPAVPAGVAVVADAQAQAMDLSWTPDTDADIAGYIVYRRDETTGNPLERITPKTLVPPSYSDAKVIAGHKYAYAVSAVDEDGNESAKSAEVEEEMPQ